MGSASGRVLAWAGELAFGATAVGAAEASKPPRDIASILIRASLRPGQKWAMLAHTIGAKGPKVEKPRGDVYQRGRSRLVRHVALRKVPLRRFTMAWGPRIAASPRRGALASERTTADARSNGSRGEGEQRNSVAAAATFGGEAARRGAVPALRGSS